MRVVNTTKRSKTGASNGKLNTGTYPTVSPYKTVTVNLYPENLCEAYLNLL